MGKAVISKKNTLPIPALSDTCGLSSYLRFVNSIPILTENEEIALAKRWRYQNDIEAAQKIVLAHLRFVVKVARGFSGYGLSINDLIQEGNIGLMKAVKRFDPEVGVRLVSFAVHWIKAEIHEYILKNWRIVKVATTKSQRKLFFNLRSIKTHFGSFSKNEIHEVAVELGVKPEVVVDMEKRMTAYDVAFESPIEEDSFFERHNNNNFNPSLCIDSGLLNPEEQTENEELKERTQKTLKMAIDQLDSRTRDIIVSRWFTDKKFTLNKLAKKYSVSAERIRQLEAMAMNQLKSTISSSVL